MAEILTPMQLHQMMASLDDEKRNDTWNEIEQRLRQFETQDGFVRPCAGRRLNALER